MFTLEDVKGAITTRAADLVDQAFVDSLNSVSTDPIFLESYKENFISFSGVFRQGKYKTTDYASAVLFVSYKLMNKTNLEAYKLTFPDRIARLTAAGKSPKDISAYVSAYAKTKLVMQIFEQSLVPAYVAHNDVYHKAVLVLAELMVGAQSEKVRCDAASSILTHLAKPKEAVQNQLNINIQDNSGLGELSSLLSNIATKQIEAIDNGVPLRTMVEEPLYIQEMDVIDDD